MYVLQRGERNGKPTWSLRFDTRDPGTGKRKYVYETFNGPRREAERRWIAREAEIQAAGAGFVKPDRQSLRDYFKAWLPRYAAENGLEPTTVEHYERMLRCHVSPALGAVALADLSAAHVQRFIDDMRAGSGPEGHEVMPRTAAAARTVLRIAMQDAVRLGLIPSNPVDRTKPPKQAPRHVDAFTPAEAMRLFDHAEGTPWRWLLEFAFYTGMRRGELIALRWEDVDQEGGAAVVRRSRVKLGGSRRGIEKAPKTKAGVRTVALPEGALDALRHQWAAQAKDKLAAREYRDEGYVFATKLGGPLGPDDVSRAFRRIRDKAGLRKLPEHALRHTAVSVQIAAGVPLEVVSKRIGHKSISTTLDTYGHLLPEANLDAAKKVDEFMRLAQR